MLKTLRVLSWIFFREKVIVQGGKRSFFSIWKSSLQKIGHGRKAEKNVTEYDYDYDHDYDDDYGDNKSLDDGKDYLFVPGEGASSGKSAICMSSGIHFACLPKMLLPFSICFKDVTHHANIKTWYLRKSSK